MATYGETDRVLVRLARIYKNANQNAATETDLLQLNSNEWAEVELYGWDLPSPLTLKIGHKPIGGGTTVDHQILSPFNTNTYNGSNNVALVTRAQGYDKILPIGNQDNDSDMAMPMANSVWPIKFNILNEYWEPGVNKQSLYLANPGGVATLAKVFGTMRVFKGV